MGMGNNVACMFFSVTLIMILNLVVPASSIVFLTTMITVTVFCDFGFRSLGHRVHGLRA